MFTNQQLIDNYLNSEIQVIQDKIITRNLYKKRMLINSSKRARQLQKIELHATDQKSNLHGLAESLLKTLQKRNSQIQTMTFRRNQPLKPTVNDHSYKIHRFTQIQPKISSNRKNITRQSIFNPHAKTQRILLEPMKINYTKLPLNRKYTEKRKKSNNKLYYLKNHAFINGENITAWETNDLQSYF